MAAISVKTPLLLNSKGFDKMLITDKNELKNYSGKKRIWQGIPSIVGTKGGRLFSTFYSGGTGEQFGNYCLLLMKERDDESWIDPVAVSAPDKPACQRVYDPNVWISPDGALWFFYTKALPCGLYASVCRDPDADELKWEQERFIGNDVMMNKPIVTTSGRWLLPIAVWAKNIFAGNVRQRENDDPIERGSFVYASDDRGQSFYKLGGADVKNRAFDEHMVIEKRDGSLEMFVRTSYGIGKSISADGGKTWSEGQDTGFGGPNSRFFITRLNSGNLLLVNHVKCEGQRKNLAAMISFDDGKSWSEPLMLDERMSVSYPDGFEASDGHIYITYDRERGCEESAEKALSKAREVLYARFTEKDVLAGELVSKGSFLKKIISALGAYDGDAEALYKK